MDRKLKRLGLVMALLVTACVMNVNAQTQRMMLIESFTNTGCVPCAQQNPTFDALLAANAERVAAVKYHTNWPSANDPMHLANAENIETRTEFYNVANVPTAIIDGNRYYSAPSGITQNIINQLLNIPSPIEMQLRLEADTLSNKLLVSAEGQATASVGGDIRLFVALVENEIRFEIPPGTNGEKDFSHVLHKFLTEASGQKLDYLDVGQQFAFNFDCEMAHSQDLNNLSALAWIQDFNTKAVHQACKCKATATSVSESGQTPLQVYPNPTEGFVHIAFSGQQVSLFNMLGECIYENDGERELRIDMRHYGPGIYVVKAGNQTQRIIVK